MKIIALFYFLALTSSAFSSEINMSCKRLVDGNVNGKARTTVKAVDLDFSLDIQGDRAQLSGTIITRGGGIFRVLNYFLHDPEIKKYGDVVELSSLYTHHDKCGRFNPCRLWERLTLDLKTGNGVFEHSYSPNVFTGELIPKISIRFTCIAQKGSA